jgi:ribosomal protein L3
MPGQYGNTQNSVKNEIVSYDAENKIIAVIGSVSGANGALGRVKVVQSRLLYFEFLRRLYGESSIRV